jgi:hypothetical protein
MRVVNINKMNIYELQFPFTWETKLPTINSMLNHTIYDIQRNMIRNLRWPIFLGKEKFKCQQIL